MASCSSGPTAVAPSSGTSGSTSTTSSVGSTSSAGRSTSHADAGSSASSSTGDFADASADVGPEASDASVLDAGPCDACAPGAIYVAPGGNDDNPGTLAQPVRTLAKAQALVQPRTATMSADIVVYLRGGTYPVTSTVALGNADSGQNGFYVRYMAYPGERPIITGGQPITGWKLTDTTNNIYSATGLASTFRQLYVNGVKAVRARSPNLGSGGAANFWRISGNDNSAQNIQVSSSYVANWHNFTKAEMHIMIGWGDATLRLASYTTQGSTAYLKVQSPESTIVFVRPNPALGGQFGGGTKHAFYFENALEFLDQPGEWYLDETANVVYYKPRPGEDMGTATVVAPTVETVVSVAGTSPDNQAGYIWFQGLAFAHSNLPAPEPIWIHRRPSRPIQHVCDGQQRPDGG